MLGPAITLLLVMAVSVGVVYQNNANSMAARSPAVGGGLDMPTLGAAQRPAPLTAALDDATAAALDNTIDAPAPVADDDTSAADPVVDDADDDDDDDTKPGPKMNATAVLSCLEDKCQPLVTQLGKTWRELGACVRALVFVFGPGVGTIWPVCRMPSPDPVVCGRLTSFLTHQPPNNPAANINLLRCLASAAFNKTAAAVCFKSAGPSELRDNLVTCAGCNKCIKLSDQASIDRACAKYDAWAEKKRAEADAADADADVDSDADATADSGATPEMVAEGQEGGVLLEAAQEPGPGPLASGLPAELKSKLCSQHWCP